MTAINSDKTVIETPKSVTFHWPYIALTAAALLIAFVLAAIFYGQLPRDTAYRFSGSAPVSWFDRGGVLAWALGVQVVFFLLALAVTLVVTGAARRLQLAETPLLRTLFAIIGNVVGLPQIILIYAMLNIFLYNIYGNSLPPLWAFALLVMIAGGVVLAVLFVRAFARSRDLKTKNTSGSESDAR